MRRPISVVRRSRAAVTGCTGARGSSERRDEGGRARASVPAIEGSAVMNAPRTERETKAPLRRRAQSALGSAAGDGEGVHEKTSHKDETPGVGFILRQRGTTWTGALLLLGVLLGGAREKCDGRDQGNTGPALPDSTV